MATAIQSMQRALQKIQTAQSECVDENSIVKNACRYKYSLLIQQARSFRESIAWLESQVYQTGTGAPCPECGVPTEINAGVEGCCVTGCKGGE